MARDGGGVGRRGQGIRGARQAPQTDQKEATYYQRGGPDHRYDRCCSVLQCVAVCCSVLQCVAMCGSVLQCCYVTHTELVQSFDSHPASKSQPEPPPPHSTLTHTRTHRMGGVFRLHLPGRGQAAGSQNFGDGSKVEKTESRRIVCCSVLQCVAVCFSVLQCDLVQIKWRWLRSWKNRRSTNQILDLHIYHIRMY